MRKLTPFIAVAALAVAALPSSVEAGGGRPLVDTQHAQGVVTIPFEGCSGEVEGFVTIDFRDTFHITEFADGRVSVTGNNRGSFSYEPFDGAPSSGHYKSGFHVTSTDKTFVSNDVFAGAGVDVNGVHNNFTVRNHVTFANGEVRVEFSAGCD